jgi:DNA-binding CsgD family transcriptional regulator
MGIETLHDTLLVDPPAKMAWRTTAWLAGGDSACVGALLPEKSRVPSLSSYGSAAQPALLSALVAAESVRTRQNTIATQLLALGFEWLGYGRFSQSGEPCASANFCTSDAERHWAKRYFDESYCEIDPRLQVALRSWLPAIWTLDQLAARAACEVPGSRLRRFVDELGDTGMRRGVMLALPGIADSGRHFVSLLSRSQGSGWMSDGLLGQVLIFAHCVHEFQTHHMGQPLSTKTPAQLAHKGLTSMQREILACLSCGHGDKTIADKLGTSLHNVDYHMRQLRKRFAVRNRVQLIKAAQTAGSAY